MSREIKFRMYDAGIKRMVPWEELQRHSVPFLFGYTSLPVMQFTGLRDKNGVEIYEGDIVTILQTDDEQFVRKYEVIMSNGSWCYQKLYTDCEIERLGSLFTFGRPNNGITVIGNIYEHPHLLEEGRP